MQASPHRTQNDLPDLPNHLPSGISSYMLPLFATPAPPCHLTPDDIDAEIEPLVNFYVQAAANMPFSRKNTGVTCPVLPGSVNVPFDTLNVILSSDGLVHPVTDGT